MKSQWLNLALRLTNQIFTVKQRIVKETGVRVVFDVLILFLLEIVLAIVSFPLYLSIRPDTAIAYMKGHGSYEKVTINYNLRRVITIAGLGTILIIWMIKLAIILFVPPLYDPLPLYKVSQLQPVPLQDEQLIATETGIQTAQINKSLSVPIFRKLELNSNGVYVFSGTAAPNVLVVMMLSAQKDSIYYGQADKTGAWKIEHSQVEFKLTEGNHSLTLFSYNQKTGERSQMSDERFFRIRSLWLDQLINNIDNLANWSLVLVIVIGLLSTFLIV